MPESTAQQRVFSMLRKSSPLYPDLVEDGGMSLSEFLTKSENRNTSSQDAVKGERPYPFNITAVIKFRTADPHHSTCLETLASALVGMGHMTDYLRDRRQAKILGTEPPVPGGEDEISKVDTLLNPLCKSTWQETQNQLAADFADTANAYLEVVRSPSGEIVGLHHIPAKDCRVVIENKNHDQHFIVRGMGTTSSKVFACFGDKENFIKRASRDNIILSQGQQVDPSSVSEVIHIRKPSSKDKYYGFPAWLSCVPCIELVQMIMQHNHDFFLNRGVPEFMALFLGEKLDDKTWKKIEESMLAQIGRGNSRKSIALNIPAGENFRVQIEKLAMEGKSEDTFSDRADSLASSIVTAHRVPPLLAGIQIAGKLGATNELPNALQAYQALVIGPLQLLWQQTWGKTLGGDQGIPGLSVSDFEYRKITEEIDIGKMDTVARMRQSPAQAEAEGRDLNDGPKD